MKYKKVYEQELKLLSTNGNNDFEKIDENEKEQYLALYSIYRKLYTEYLIKELGLKEIDQSIADSGLSFSPIKEEDMDFYQYFSADDLKYLYLRNNIYVERLEDGEKAFFEQRISSKNYRLDEKAEEVIGKSLKRVTAEYDEKDNQTKAFFGPTTSSYLVPSNSIVIGMNYDEFADTNMSDAEWDEQHTNQIVYLAQLFNIAVEKIKRDKNLLVSFIRYNKLTTVRRTLDKSNIKNMEEER